MPQEHKLHAIEALGTPQLAVEVANAITNISLYSSRWVMEVLQTSEVEPDVVCQPSHFCWQCQNIWVEAKVEHMEGGERADAQGNGTEGIVAEVQAANGRSNSIGRHRSELVVREVEHSEAGGPLRDV